VHSRPAEVCPVSGTAGCYPLPEGSHGATVYDTVSPPARHVGDTRPQCVANVSPRRNQKFLLGHDRRRAAAATFYFCFFESDDDDPPPHRFFAALVADEWQGALNAAMASGRRMTRAMKRPPLLQRSPVAHRPKSDRR